MQITELLKLIHSLILEGTDKIIILLFSTFAFFLYCISKGYNFFQPRKRRVLELEKLLEKKSISKSRQRNIERQIRALEYLTVDKDANIITNNLYLQIAIVEIHEFAKGRIRASDFRIALPLLITNSDSRLKVGKLKIHHYVFIVICAALAIIYFSGACAFLFSIWLVFTKYNLEQKTAILLLMVFPALILSFFFFSTSMAQQALLLIPNARKIEKEIKKYKKAKIE